MRYYIRHLYQFLLALLFLLVFFKSLVSAQDLVRLGKVGEWNNNYGNFNAVDVKEINGVTYAFCATSKGMAVFNISYKNIGQNRTKAEVSLISFVPLGDCTDIIIEEGEGYEKDLYAYITVRYKGLYIRNVTNPVFSYHIGTCNTPGWAEGMAISGDYAFVAAGDSGLRAIDISDKEGPVIVGNCDTPGDARGVTLFGNYAFVADGDSGLQVIDISNKKGPLIIGSCDTPGSTWGVGISGEYAFVTDGDSGLQVIDISNKKEPWIVGTYDTPGEAKGVALSGDYAFVASWFSLQVIDISNKKSPVIVSSCNTSHEAYGVAISRDNAFVACTSSLQVIDISNKEGPLSVGYCDTPGWAYGVVLSGDYAFVVDGKGLQVIDISDKEGPEIVGSCDTPGHAVGIAISGDYAFVTTGSSLQVIDISDKKGPEIVGTCYTYGHAKGIAISGEYAFVANGRRGLQVRAISDKECPEIVGSCDTPGIAYGVALSGDYAFVVDGKGLQVIDISDKECPEIVGSCNTPGWAEGIAISGDYAFVADYERGLQIIDISNKESPVIVGVCDTLGLAKGVAISGDRAFVTAGKSLKIIDISIKESPVVAGGCYISVSATEVAISGEYAFVADWENGLQIIDISYKGGPVSVGYYNARFLANGVAISGDYAFVTNSDYSGLQVIDISDNNGLKIVGTCNTPDRARGIALTGDYAFVAYYERGLHIIDISNKGNPVIVGSCYTPGWTKGVAISGDYAFVADGNVQVIDISDKEDPVIVGACDTPGSAAGVAIAGDYAFVVDGDSGLVDGYSSLQVIDISDKENPKIIGDCGTPGSPYRIAISGDYAYVVIMGSILQVIDISNKEDPVIVGTCDISGVPNGIAISGDYAYVAIMENSLQVIDISNKEDPVIVGACDTLGSAEGVAISGDYAFVAVRGAGLQKLKINIGPPPDEMGNLILVAGGNINYKSLSYSSLNQQPTNTTMRKRGTTSDSPDNKTSYCQIIQALANHVFNTSQNSGFEVYDIYYFNPDPFQDTDNDGTFNQLVVDDSTPTYEELMEIIRQFPEDHLVNNGPLYIYLLGHAVEYHFLIMANEIIFAQNLKDAITEFQESTHREVFVIIESAASGTFINDLTGPDITVITSTDDGSSYIKPDFRDSNNISYNSFTKAFMDALAPSESPPETLLKEAFIAARDQLNQWALAGQPFGDQAPQMAIPEAQSTLFDFFADPITHISINTVQDIPYYLTIFGYDSNKIPFEISDTMAFFSSDHNILDPENTDDILMIPDPFGRGIPVYSIFPKKNGRVSLIAYTEEETNPHHLLSARITIDVSIDDPGYFKDTNRIAIIVAGYHGTGDYLWDSTNHIANHAYKTLLNMGYTRQEIHYYNPYYLQDPDENGIYDDIDGYPKLEIFDPYTDPNSPYAAFSKTHNLHNPNTKIKELFLFLVDHGTRETFCLNPTRSLDADYLIDNIEAAAEKVSGKIIFLYDACYSGSFLDKIKERTKMDPSPLSEKLITITSTDPNQIAYYLNQGIISFAYPFFDEWYLTHSLSHAFEYARDSLPRFGGSVTSLKGQDPGIFDPNVVRLWDLEHIYYTDDVRPLIDHVQAHRREGNLNLSADVFSLRGIKGVWAIIESANNTLASSHGKAITETTQFPLSPVGDPDSPYGGSYQLITPDPCPAEATYTINIYAMDKSEMRKTAFYKTGISDQRKNKTRALILATAPDLFPDKDDLERFCSQLDRAKKILQRKIMDPSSIIEIHTINKLKEHLDPNIHPLEPGQTLFVYIFGKTVAQENNEPCFCLNPNEYIDPEDLFPRLPRDPNQRVLILMDTPYARQFLYSSDPKTWHENWAGIGSTNQGELFFPIGSNTLKRFPCFSGFFFSFVLSGATVAQANRMAKNAVSLTQQHPKVFLKKEAQTEYDINRHLSYYLGTSAIQGEDYSLFTDCSARVENNQLWLSLTAHPQIEESDFTAWVILKSSPSSIYQKTDIIYLSLDPNSLSSQDKEYENRSGLVYEEAIPYNPQFCKALFIMEGRLKGKTEKTWIEHQEVPIAAPVPYIKEDSFEPDNDPDIIMHYAKNEIIVNNLPLTHTFYCEDNTPYEECNDPDWVYFHSWEGISYEIYAQDLSEYGYFINLTLYGPDQSLHDPNVQTISADNYLGFTCRRSGYHLLRVTLASSYPEGGIEYILAVCSPQAAEFTKLRIKVVNPRVKGVRSPITVTCEDQELKSLGLVYPDSFWYEPSFLIKGNDNVIMPYNKVTVKVYQGSEAQGIPLCTREIDLKPRMFHYLEIELKVCTYPGQTGCIDPKEIAPPDFYKEYEDKVIGWKEDITRPEYPWDESNPLPEGDMDDSFPPDGDFDGDRISNYDEHLFSTSCIYQTLPLFVQQGINLYYFPSIEERPSFGQIQEFYYDPNSAYGSDSAWKIKDPSQENPYICSFYDKETKKWEGSKRLKSQKFNVIDAQRPGILYLNLTALEHPVLSLRGFVNPEYLQKRNLADLDINLPDPEYFDINVSTLEILNTLGPLTIETISGENYHKGSWEASYRFFGRTAGEDIYLMPDQVYVIDKNE